MKPADWMLLSRLADGEACYMQRGALRFGCEEKAVSAQVIDRCRKAGWVSGQGRLAITPRGSTALQNYEEERRQRRIKLDEAPVYRRVMVRNGLVLSVAKLGGRRRIHVRLTDSLGHSVDALFVSRQELLDIGTTLIELAYRMLPSAKDRASKKEESRA